MSDALNVLDGAIELLSDPEHWIKGVEARDAYGISCDPMRIEAVSFCMNGALKHASIVDDRDHYGPGFFDAWEAVADVMPRDRSWRSAERLSIGAYNDRKTTTHASMLRRLKQARKALEEA